MIDLVEKFSKYEKQISRYVRERIDWYDKSDCKKFLKSRVERLNDSWDMMVGQVRHGGGQTQNQNSFIGQLSYPLVKQQMLTRRAIFTHNFRADPLFTLRAIGNTPAENAINMQDLLESNNQQIEFRPRVLNPSINQVVRWGASVIYTEYAQTEEYGFITVADPVLGSRRINTKVKDTKNAQCYIVDPLNYFQNPKIVSCDSSDFRGHRERRKLSWLINRAKTYPDLYIKDNVEKVIREVKKSNALDADYYDPQQRQSKGDFDRIAINDIVRGQFQIHFDGNEDDSTYYYIEMIGDTIIRIDSNQYDMNLNQYTVLTCEPRWEYWWGNTPAEYSSGNEDRLNLLLSLGVENALEGMKRYVFYNKNAIDPRIWNRVPHNGKIPVDVSKDTQLHNLLWTYQVPNDGIAALDRPYSWILENDQRLASHPDLSRPAADGGVDNKTATAAQILNNKGDTMDADILEVYSHCLSQVAKKETVILAQFLGNFGPILIRPLHNESIRQVRKQNITGNYMFTLDTALQKSYQGEMMRYQNIITWLLNLVNAGIPVKPNFQPLIKQVMKMGQFMNLDDVLPDQMQMQQPDYVPTQVTPGQELAGAGQDVAQQAQSPNMAIPEGTM